MSKEFSLTPPKSEGDYNVILEQYKMLVESINKLNDTREFSNNFWVEANGVGVSVLAYLRDAHNIHEPHKCFLLMTLIAMGMLFCLSWISYFATIKKSVDMRGEILVNLEKKLSSLDFFKDLCFF